MHDILDIIKNVQTIYSTNSTLSVLKDIERVLDEMDLYVYQNLVHICGCFAKKNAHNQDVVTVMIQRTVDVV